ncbi:MAG: InlB B-repeat-containing protein, partial [Oscillospiraceae bacterium]|nr:InlB B-repeat-containing protein [Oscillospiraceae bacterium]
MKTEVGKRTISFLLVLALCLTLLPATALAGSQDWLEAIYYDNNRMEQYGYGTNDGYLMIGSDGAVSFDVSGGVSVSQNCTISGVWLVDAETEQEAYNLLNSAYGGTNQCQIHNMDSGFGVEIYITGIKIPNASAGEYRLKVTTSAGSYVSTAYQDEYFSTDGIVRITKEADTPQPAGQLTILSPSNLPGAKQGEAYSVTFAATPAVQGDQVTWSLTGGSIPQGLSLTSAGVLSGTPTEYGSFTMVIRATEAGSGYIESTFFLSVSQRPTGRVTFDLNGGTPAQGASYDPVTADIGSPITLPAAPERQGFRFMGWFAAGEIYEQGSSYTVKGSACLVAQWQGEEITLHFPATAPGVSGDISLYAYKGGNATFIWSKHFNSETDLGSLDALNLWKPSMLGYESLKLFAYIDNMRVCIASYTGEMTGDITLEKADVEWKLIKEVIVNGADGPLVPDKDYTAGSLEYSAGGTRRYIWLSGEPRMVSADSTDWKMSFYNYYLSGNEASYIYDFTKYKYDLTENDGQLTLTLEPMEKVNVTGTVTYGDDDRPMAGVTLSIRQSAGGNSCSITAVTDENGRYSAELYAGKTAYYYAYFGGRNMNIERGYTLEVSAENNTKNIHMGSAVLSTKITIIPAEGQEKLAMRYLDAAQFYDDPQVTVKSGDEVILKDRVSRYNFTAEWNLYLKKLAGDGTLTVTVEDEAYTESTATCDFAGGAGSVSLTTTFKPGVIINLNSTVLGNYYFMWFDADNASLGYTNPIRVADWDKDFAFVCPENASKLVMVPSVYSDAKNAGSFDDLPNEAVTHQWSVHPTEGVIEDLGELKLDRTASANALYVTLPNSSIHTTSESFVRAGEMLIFTGSIGLDDNLSDGRLRDIYISHGNCTFGALVINGKTYEVKEDTFGSRLTLTGRNDDVIELPCDYTLYLYTATTQDDAEITIRAEVSYTGGLVPGQLVGTATVKKPSCSIEVFSDYVCSDTVKVTGTAGSGAEVSIFDNGNFVGAAKADWYGDWEAEVSLYRPDPNITTIHNLTAVAATLTAPENPGEGIEYWFDPDQSLGEIDEAESNQITVIHNAVGPELVSLYMQHDSYGTPTILPVGSSYTKTYMYDVKFGAEFKNPDKLKKLDGFNSEVAFKVFFSNGSILFLEGVR